MLRKAAVSQTLSIDGQIRCSLSTLTFVGFDGWM
jgi:hypothetical protein